MAKAKLDPLFAAVRAGAAQVKKALAGGADVGARNADGQTALFEAYRQPGIARLLLDAGIDVDAVDKSGRTALMDAFVAADADRKSVVATTKLYLARGPDLERTDEYGNTVLMLAVRIGYPRHVKLLVEANARCDVEDESGTPLLVHAADNRDEASALSTVRVVLTAKTLPGAAAFEQAIENAEGQEWTKVVALLKKSKRPTSGSAGRGRARR